MNLVEYDPLNIRQRRTLLVQLVAENLSCHYDALSLGLEHDVAGDYSYL